MHVSKVVEAFPEEVGEQTREGRREVKVTGVSDAKAAIAQGGGGHEPLIIWRKRWERRARRSWRHLSGMLHLRPHPREVPEA